MSSEMPSATAPTKTPEELEKEQATIDKLNKFARKTTDAPVDETPTPAFQAAETSVPQESQPNQGQLESDPLAHLTPEQQAYWTEIFANQKELDKSGEHVMVNPMDLKKGDIVITNAGRFSSGYPIKNYLQINRVDLNPSGPYSGSVDIMTENVDGQRGTTHGISMPKTGAPMEVIRLTPDQAQETQLTPEKKEELQNKISQTEKTWQSLRGEYAVKIYSELEKLQKEGQYFVYLKELQSPNVSDDQKRFMQEQIDLADGKIPNKGSWISVEKPRFSSKEEIEGKMSQLLTRGYELDDQFNKLVMDYRNNYRELHGTEPDPHIYRPIFDSSS